VQPIAAKAVDILDGGVIKKIQDFINEKLDLSKVRTVVTQNDFDVLDGWLVKRLGDFLDKELDLAGVKEIQAAISLVIKKASDFYEKGVKALNNHYSLEFAASYQRTTTNTALLDVNFDMTQQLARDSLQLVVAKSRFDDLLAKTVAGVTLNAATLTHEIKRNADVQVHMPFLDSDVQHINDSLATLTVEHDAGRILAYQLSATDSVTSKNRFMSQLSILGKLEVIDGKIQMAAASDQAISYQSLQVKSKASFADLEFRTREFLETLLGNVFSNGASLDRFYFALDQTISNSVGNRNNNFGDMAIDLQVAMPAGVLASWFRPLNDSQLKSACTRMSVALQDKLKALIPQFYFQDLNKLQPNPTAAALLVWAAMPSVSTDSNFFWDFEDVNLRKGAAMDSRTRDALMPALATARQRFLDAGDKGTAGFFAPNQVESFRTAATGSIGDLLVHSLLFTEAEMVQGAADTLKDIQKMLATAATAPTQAIKRFAEYGAHLTSTFNKSLSIYGNESLRTLNSMLLVEASKAVDLGSAAMVPTAMASLLVLTPQHKFQLADFLTGGVPPREEIAIGQTLTNLA